MKPVIVIGAGGHGRVVLDALLASGREVAGFVDKNDAIQQVLGCKRLGGDDYVLSQPADSFELANGLGAIGVPGIRKKMFVMLREKGYAFAQVIHPSASIGREVEIGEGALIMAGAVVQSGAVIGDNVIINTRAGIDHDCQIGAHTHIAPGVTLSGCVVIEDEVHIGTGASIIQGISVGKGSVVGAGGVVVRNVPAGVTVMGVPAKIVK